MATWDPPSDADLAPGKPGKASLARRIRDLSTALAERASGAPWLNAAATEVIITHFGSGRHKTLRGTWEVPADVYWIHVWALGGGGAGGSKAAFGDAFLFGGGGGAGGICERTIPVTPGQEIPITIGAGGYPEGYTTPPPGSRSQVADPTVDTTLDNFRPGDGARTTVGTPPYHVIALGGKRGEAVTGEGGDGASGDPYTVVIDGVEVVVPRTAGASGGRGGDISLPPFLFSGPGADSFFGGGGESRWGPDPSQIGLARASMPGAGGAGGVGSIKDRDRFGGFGGNGLVIIRY